MARALIRLAIVVVIVFARAPHAQGQTVGGIPRPAPGKGAIVRWETIGAVMSGLQKGTALTYSWAKFAQDAMTYGEVLTQEDAGYVPSNPPGSPRVPSHCASAEGRAKCQQCGFAQTHAGLARVRERFERLRVVYAATKAYTARALATGDSMAGAAAATGVALGGLPWIEERMKIEQAMKTVDAAYDTKYAELTATLQEALQGMAACEEHVFGEKDWYDRYGFVFYQFMVAAYRRP